MTTMSDELPEVVREDEARWGPAMRRLSERQQAFVLAVMDGHNNADAAIIAKAQADLPNSKKGSFKSRDAAKQAGFKMAHDPAVLEAIHEMSLGRIRATAPKAIAALEEAVENPGPDSKIKVKAAGELLSRGGLGIVVNTQVNATVVHREESQEAVIEEITRLAKFLELDANVLLGYDPKAKQAELYKALPGPAREIIEAEFTPVDSDPVDQPPRRGRGRPRAPRAPDGQIIPEGLRDLL